MRNGRPRKRDDLDIQRIVLLRESGFSWGQVARSLGVGRNTLGLRRHEDPVFRNLTDIKRGKPSAEDEAAMILLAETESRIDTPRRLRCRDCSSPLSLNDGPRCSRCNLIQRAVEDCEADCAVLFTKEVSEGKRRRQQLIASLPNDMRKLVRKIEGMTRKGAAVDLATKLRRTAEALEAIAD